MAFAASELTRDKFLGGAVEALQPRRGYRSGVDPVLLAASVPAKPGESVLEIGCGAGVALLCLCGRVPGLRASGLELQPEYAELAVRNAELNGQRLEILVGDVARPPAALAQQSFDHAFANPPYRRRGSGAASAQPDRELAMSESVPLAAWVDCLLRRLKPSGLLSVIVPAGRFPELLRALEGRAGSVAAKPFQPRFGQDARRLVVRAKKGARGEFRVLAPMVLHEGRRHADGSARYSEEARQVLREGAAIEF